MTQKFGTKPLQVEAVQFTDQNKNIIYLWAKSIQANVFHSWDENGQPTLKIPTSEGEEVECSFGDYIIVKPFPTDWCKLSLIKQFVFEQTYKPE
jgi:hypothetical protein